jgi:transposase-like protein
LPLIKIEGKEMIRMSQVTMDLPKPRLSSPQWSETERSDGERKGGDDNRPTASAPVPDPEVSARPTRRQFSAQYKAQIVEEVSRCTQPGQIGALLRREGLVSSQLSLWRRQCRQGVLKALRDDKRGRTPIHDPRDRELDRLRQENTRLTQKLKQAETIIEIQKKVAALLGHPGETTESIEKSS